MSALADALRDPIALAPNRIPRFYRGGMLLDRFRGAPAPVDDDRPEDWVGSVTATWTPPGTAATSLGISAIRVSGQPTSLAHLLVTAPAALVGEAMLDRAGPTTGVLVKLLDAGQRLPVHCHPSRGAAARLLGSRFGKTEAWLILGTRDEKPASVWIGFRDDVEPSQLRAWIDDQDTAALLGALVEHAVTAGDVLLVGAGVPHAIGAGVFLLELQEPTDFSVVAETSGFPIDPDVASLRLGWDTALEFFDRSAASPPRQAATPVTAQVSRLLGPAADPFFRLLRQRVAGDAAPPFEPAYAVGVVLGGVGTVHGARQSLALEAGTTFALPAVAVEGARVVGVDLDLAWCLGPAPEALDAAPLPRIAP